MRFLVALVMSLFISQSMMTGASAASFLDYFTSARDAKDVSGKKEARALIRKGYALAKQEKVLSGVRLRNELANSTFDVWPYAPGAPRLTMQFKGAFSILTDGSDREVARWKVSGKRLCFKAAGETRFECDNAVAKVDDYLILIGGPALSDGALLSRQ